ncbi:hypothetical protein KJ359_012238 [Pestalotiopsis sp. 9143b]|nr:hypothetical protein KJ359_012238 [Pestalotiopsis sp. 9143b]
MRVSGGGDSSTPLALTYSEDCLYIDVYMPANATKGGERGLPVMLWIQGGGFTQLFNPNYNGTGLIQAAQGDAIVVTFNYRVGPYGFLASKELAAEGNLNIALQDQRAAMAWVQNHIGAFGGDADRVTLFGTSIGGGSVLLQLFAYGGDESKAASAKWSAGIAQSVYLPSIYTVDQMEFHYAALLDATNCSDVACLRSLSSDEIQAANVVTSFPGQEQVPLFGYGPVVDGGLVPNTTLNLLAEGRFFKNRPMIIGTSDSEGTLFAPQANTTDDINSFMKTQLPNLTTSTLEELESLYADTPATFPGVAADVSPLFYRAADIYGDASFACPAVTIADGLSRAGVPVYLFLDRIQDPVEVAAGILTPHTWEVQAVWGPQYATNYAALPGADGFSAGGPNAAVVPVVQAYWTSFARSSGDPNALRDSGAPVWEKYGLGKFLNLETNATYMATLSQERTERCVFWAGLKQQTDQ